LTTEEGVENRNTGPDAVERAGVGRNQNVLHEVAHDPAAVSEFIMPALARVERDLPGIQLLVLTPDAEVAIAVAEAAARAPEDIRAQILPVTTARRAARLLSSGTPGGLAGTPDEILSLVQSSRVRLESVTTLVIAWADAILDAGNVAFHARQRGCDELGDSSRVVRDLVKDVLVPAYSGAFTRAGPRIPILHPFLRCRLARRRPGD
jgi:hypothetical protein